MKFEVFHCACDQSFCVGRVVANGFFMFSIDLQGLSPLLHLQQDGKMTGGGGATILVRELYPSLGMPVRKLDLFINCDGNKQKTDQMKRSEGCNIITIFLLSTFPHHPIAYLHIFIWGEVINFCLVKKNTQHCGLQMLCQPEDRMTSTEH